MATAKCIALEIAKLSIYYTYPERSAAEQEALSRMWSEDLGDDITDGEFSAAVAQWRRRSRYWPTLADLLELVEAGRASARAARAALPEVMTPEEAARSAENARKILREVCGKSKR